MAREVVQAPVVARVQATVNNRGIVNADIGYIADIMLLLENRLLLLLVITSTIGDEMGELFRYDV